MSLTKKPTTLQTGTSRPQSETDKLDKAKNIAIDDILKHADMREMASETSKARIKKELHSHWKKSTATQRPKLWNKKIPMALAASILFLSLLGLLFSKNNVTREILLEQVHGDIAIFSNQQKAIKAQPGSRLTLGSSIKTTTSGSATILLPMLGNVRLDSNSQLTFNEVNHLLLESGRIYFESSNNINHSQIKITTNQGTIKNTGTQFEVQSQSNALSIRVREGSIYFDSNYGSQTLQSGYQLTTLPSGTSQTNAIDANDSSWNWIHALAPQFELEGKSLHQYLLWVSREYALEIEFTRDTELQSRNVLLHGDIELLELEQALKVVFSATRLKYELKGKTLIVSANQSSSVE